MSELEYQLVLRMLMLLAHFIKHLDLDSFLFAIEQFDMLGPNYDPTLYQSSIPKMQDLKQLALAAKTFQDEVRRQSDANP